MFSVLRKISAFAGSRRGLLKKSMLVAFLGAVFTAFQFWALMLTLEILVAGASLSIWPVIGVMLVSVAGRTACSYWSTNAETETGYFMVAEKRMVCRCSGTWLRMERMSSKKPMLSISSASS